MPPRHWCVLGVLVAPLAQLATAGAPGVSGLRFDASLGRTSLSTNSVTTPGEAASSAYRWNQPSRGASGPWVVVDQPKSRCHSNEIALPTPGMTSPDSFLTESRAETVLSPSIVIASTTRPYRSR